jgi:hypothetical protein
MGYVVYICGQIGAGKTTMGAAVCNMLALVKNDQASQMVRQVVDCLPDVDFNPVDRECLMAYSSGLTNSDAIIDFLFRDVPGISGKFEGWYYDYLYPRTKASLLKDYVKARIALIRNNYVYFNLRKFYCWPSDCFAMSFDPKMLDIKARHETKDFQGQAYTVFYEDEKILSGSDSLHYSDISKEDGGKCDFFRLIRNSWKGTIHYVTTTQDFTRDAKLDREVATDVFYVTERKEIPCFSFAYVGYSIAYQVLQVGSGLRSYFLSVRNRTSADGLTKRIACLAREGKDASDEKKKLEEVSSDPSLKPSRIRNAICHLSGKLKKIYSDEFIRYRFDHWTSASDFDRGVQPEQSSFCFPLAYAYGSADTYEFSFLGDQLSLEAIDKADWYDPSDHSIPAFDPAKLSALTDEILKRRLKGRETSFRGSANVSAAGKDPFE